MNQHAAYTDDNDAVDHDEDGDDFQSCRKISYKMR
jgi:hypothetical protein